MMDQSHYGISRLYSCYIAALSVITTAIVSKNEEHYNKFGCYEAKIEESEKAGSRRESSPGHLWFEPPVLCH